MSILHALVFDRIFGLRADEIRKGGNIEYTIEIGGALGAVAQGHADGAFLMNPPSIHDVERVSDAGATMPEKSTYFYPKLLTGLVMNPLFDDQMIRASVAIDLLVRHGETEGESSIRYHGRTDVALSELGRDTDAPRGRAIETNRGGADFRRAFSRVRSLRASEGARIVAGDSAPLVTIDEFAEVHFGLFEGLTADEIRERYPDEFARWNADRLAPTYTYPEGESRAAFTDRVERGLRTHADSLDAARSTTRCWSRIAA